MDGLRRQRTLIASVAIVALLGNVIAGLFSPAFARGNAWDWPADLLGPQVICSEHGSQILGSGNGNSPEPPAKHCPICLAAQALFALALMAAAFLLVPLPSGQRFALHHPDRLVDRLRRAGLGSRAPPLPA